GNFGSLASLRAYEPVGKELEKSADALDAKFGVAGEAALGFAGAIIGVGAAAAGITHEMLDLAQSIENTAAATGLSTDTVQQFGEVAKEMGVDAGSLEMAFSRMQSQLGEFVATGSAAGSGSQYFVRVLRQLNVALTDARGNLRPVNDVLGDFYDELQKIPNQGERAALEMAALGTRGRVVAQVFNEAQREGLSYRDMLAKIQGSGVVLTDAQLDSLTQAKSKWDEVGRSIRGAWTQLKLFTSQAVIHPLSTAGNLVAYGAVTGAVVTNDTAGAGLPAGGSGAATAQGAENVLALGANQQVIEKLRDRLELLKAGGAEQLQLRQAEAKYAAAVKQHQTALAAQYKEEIADIKQIIALQSAKRAATPKNTEALARQAKAQQEAAAREATAQARSAAASDLEVQRASLALQQTALDQSYERKEITVGQYYAKLKQLAAQGAADEIAALTKERDAELAFAAAHADSEGAAARQSAAGIAAKIQTAQIEAQTAALKLQGQQYRANVEAMNEMMRQGEAAYRELDKGADDTKKKTGEAANNFKLFGSAMADSLQQISG